MFERDLVRRAVLLGVPLILIGSLTFATFLVAAVWIEFGRKPITGRPGPFNPVSTERGTRRVL